MDGWRGPPADVLRLLTIYRVKKEEGGGNGGPTTKSSFHMDNYQTSLRSLSSVQLRPNRMSRLRRHTESRYPTLFAPRIQKKTDAFGTFTIAILRKPFLLPILQSSLSDSLLHRQANTKSKLAFDGRSRDLTITPFKHHATTIKCPAG